MNEIIATTQLIGALQGFLLGSVIISRKKNRLANRIFSVLVLLISVSMLGRFFIINEMFLIAQLLGLIVIPGMLLFGPLLYLYTAIVTGDLEIIPRRFYYHGIPSAAALIFHGAVVCGGRHEFIPPGPAEGPPFPALLAVGFLIVSTVCYLSCSWRLLVRHRKGFRGEIPAFNRSNIMWMRVLLGSMTGMFILMNILFWFRPREMNPPDMPVIGPLLMVFFIFIVTFYALYRPELFREYMPADNGNQSSPEVCAREKTEKKYGKHSLDRISGRRYAKLLIDYMEKEKPFLDENLTLGDLADEVGIPTHHLSIVINLHLEQNFYFFINRYRIEEVKKKLGDSSYSTKSILSIALECGFNSKAAFNKFFKKSMGMTPSEFRKNIRA